MKSQSRKNDKSKNSLLLLPTVADTEKSVSTLRSKVTDYLQLGLEGASNTRRAYAADLRHYRQWCQTHQERPVPIPTEALCMYLAFAAETDKWATIQRRLSAVRKLHDLQGVDYPVQDRQVQTVLEGIRRTIGVRQQQSPAFSVDEFREVIQSLDVTNPQQLRDKVVLLLGFTGAFRRSELVALNLEDLLFTSEGAIIRMRRSKTNQYGDHEEKALFTHADADLCPVQTLHHWMAQRPERGPLLVRFRKGSEPGLVRLTNERLSDKSVARLVKHYLGEQYSAHSLRASFVTIAKLNGADDLEVMQQTKHKTSAMIQRYTRVANVTKFNAGKKLGL
ncbi:site-specific integrase [Spirosoma utsteinense]|uniref:Site-specific recombinase XerD n=1 Tax=Spirosoma utsteinense TaxID=2585773 RepID=A0ABR6WFH6_9BACT|nr:site-specific integrase [Spirosoma utsteinense]MBC3788901.1 site-specific recombinase XerD [Spirosoma utsteinense]MBC3794771.1 site-specific recombinase XerD [Spirosoma utsteinense]